MFFNIRYIFVNLLRFYILKTKYKIYPLNIRLFIDNVLKKVLANFGKRLKLKKAACMTGKTILLM